MWLISKLKECFSKLKRPKKELMPEKIAQKIKYSDMYLAQMACMDEYLSDLAEIEREKKQENDT